MRSRANPRRWSFPGAWTALLVGVGLCAVPRADARMEASVSRHNILVLAVESSVADAVAIEAERMADRFLKIFDLKTGRRSTPIVLVLGNEHGKSPHDDGKVRVFSTEGGAKLQVDWDDLPILPDSFRRGCARAFCTRQAIEAARASGMLQRASDRNDMADLRLPAWISEGVAVLLMESSGEVLGRAALLARTEPEMSLDEALAALEGGTDPGPTERAMAAVFCEALTAKAAIRDRFLQHMMWDAETTPRGWLASILETGDLDAWWRQVWQGQSERIPWLKLGYLPTLRWVLSVEAASGAKRGEGDAPKNSHKPPPDLGGIAHPWFRPWLLARTTPSASSDNTASLIRDIRARRAAALVWFAGTEETDGLQTRAALLLWARTRLAGGAGTAPPPGPSEVWFDALPP